MSFQNVRVGNVALAFHNARSTWCSMMNETIASCTDIGIATASTIAWPGSVNASPSAGSAVTAAISYGGSPSD